MSGLEKDTEKGKRTMRPAIEIAAERWGMKGDVKKEEPAPAKPLVNTQGHDAIAGLTAWAERPGVKESPGRKQDHDIEDPLRST